jgi:FtsZ-interacting cell division protein ZipA
MIGLDTLENMLIVLGVLVIIGTVLVIGWNEARTRARVEQELEKDETNPARLNHKGAS